MKKFVKFSEVVPTGVLTIDFDNPEFRDLGVEKYIEQLISEDINLATIDINSMKSKYEYTMMGVQEFLKTMTPMQIYAQITVANFKVIPVELMHKLTHQYLHGAKIIISAPNRLLDKMYQMPIRPYPMYAYYWTELDLTAPIPKSLAEFKFIYKGKLTTYRDAISTLKTTKYLPNQIWNAIDEYSRNQIEKCKKYNLVDFAEAELWYRELVRDCIEHKISVYSPNEKTYYEVAAQMRFERDIKDTKLQKGLQPLNEEQLSFLRTYAHIYGVEIPQLQWRYNYRKTPNHGYTEEIERVTGGMSNSDWAKATYDYRNADKEGNLPKDVRNRYVIQYEDCDRFLRDAYFQLIWLIKHMGDEALMPGYHRCPECHKIYHEKDGCECGHCPPITQFDAYNRFYGIPSSDDDDSEFEYEFEEDEDWA